LLSVLFRQASNPTSFLAITFFVGCFAIQAQIAVPLHDQVPEWPRNGQIPPQQSGHYVFYDADKDEFVVAYPVNIGEPNVARNSAKLRVYHVPTSRGARARITFEVTPVQGKFKYTYRVSNGANAKKAIMSWDLALPEKLEGEINPPRLWRGVNMPPLVRHWENPASPGLSSVGTTTTNEHPFFRAKRLKRSPLSQG
jgi:hypothetical protein